MPFAKAEGPITMGQVIDNVLAFLNTKKLESVGLYDVYLLPGAKYRMATDPQGRAGFVLGPCKKHGQRSEQGLFMLAEDAFLLWVLFEHK